MEAQDLTKPTTIDLFAGAGGFSLGALIANTRLLAAIELDPDACNTYRVNIIKNRSPKTKLFENDILELDPKSFREELDLEWGELDCLIGGPPCQGFSTHRINNKGVDDPRNQLLLRYFDFVKELNPKLFLVENVPGLLWARHALYLQHFKELSNNNGYNLFGPIKLNARDFGVPQNRSRIFILGVRADQNVYENAWPPAPTHFGPEKGSPQWIPAASVFSKPPRFIIKHLEEICGIANANNLPFHEHSLDAKDPSAIHMNHSAQLVKRFAETPVNGSRSDNPFTLSCHSNGHDGHKDVYGRIRLSQPGPTITTGCFNPSRGRFLHPWKNHGITIRHAARFQTFPDDYTFCSGITSQGRQIGNAVPVRLAEVVLTAALRCIGKQKETSKPILAAD